jgi:hypothetical protein
VGPNGEAWVRNFNQDIYRWNGSSFIRLPGKARDIGVGANGIAWAIGANVVSGDGFGVYRWDGSNWEAMPGAGFRITVGPQGEPWVVNSHNDIYRWSG